jgi:hypothetical protein
MHRVLNARNSALPAVTLASLPMTKRLPAAPGAALPSAASVNLASLILDMELDIFRYFRAGIQSARQRPSARQQAHPTGLGKPQSRIRIRRLIPL